MVSLYLTKCLRISDHHKEEVAVVIVVCSLNVITFAESIVLKESKILTFAINGDQDILKDETCNDNNIVSYILWRY